MLIQSQCGENYLTFDDEKHIYNLNGEIVPGVTGFIKGGLPTAFYLTSWMIGKGAEFVVNYFRDWRTSEDEFPNADKVKELIKRAKTAYRKDAQAAADIGSIVHDYAYLVETNHPDRAQALIDIASYRADWAKIKNGIDKFVEWKKENNDEVVGAEQIVASVDHQFGGKFDRLGLRGKRLVLSDFKTSNGIYLDQFIQLGAYALAIKEWLGKTVDEIEILRFGKESGEFEVKGFKRKTDIKAFMDQAIRCRETFECVKTWEKKINGF